MNRKSGNQKRKAVKNVAASTKVIPVSLRATESVLEFIHRMARLTTSASPTKASKKEVFPATANESKECVNLGKPSR